MAPGVGIAFDLVNAGISVFRGNFVDAGLSLGCAIPGLGQGIGAGKIAVHATMFGAGLAKGANKTRKLWNPVGNTISHQKFGKFIQDKTNPKMWWTKDLAGHGCSSWKLFNLQGNKMKHLYDVDEYGNYILNKHKGPIGIEIPWKEFFGK